MPLRPALRACVRGLALLSASLVAGCGGGEERVDPAPLSPYPLEPVELLIDDLGISHVYATSDADAFFGAGYAMARDRLLQMELVRRQALGRRAEIFGEGALGWDITARTFDFARLGRHDLEKMRAESPDDARLVDAWVSGVNARIEEIARGTAPRPYGLRETELDFLPSPWEPEHGLAIGKLLVFGLSNTIEPELVATALERLAPKAMGSIPMLMPAYDEFIAPHAPASPTSGGAPPLSPSPSVSLKPGAEPWPTSDWNGSFPRLFSESGSNNWAVAAERSESGRPLLAGDPHQSLSSPSRFWPVHMSTAAAGGTLDVIGFAFAGTPAVQLGHNASIAWTASVNFADVMDIWDVAIVGAYERVVVGDVEHEVVERDVQIRVRAPGGAVGSGEVVTAQVREVPGLGVLLPDEVLPVPRALLAKGALLFSWTGFRATGESAAFLGMDRAKSIAEFEIAADRLEVGAMNFIAADASDILYYAPCSIPDRGAPAENPMPWRILPGTAGGTLWTRGDLPRSKLPRRTSPASGFLASANNDPLGFTANGSVEDDPYYMGAFYDGGTRAHRIGEALTELLADGKLASHEDMEELQRDVRSPMADTLLPHLAAAVAAIGSDPALAVYENRPDLVALASRLAAWDRRFDRDEPDPVIFLGLEWFAARRAFEGTFSSAVFEAIQNLSPPFFLWRLRNVLERRYAGAEASVPDGDAALLLGALDDARQWVEARFGSVDADYRLGDVQAAVFSAELSGALDVARVPVGGSADTVNVAAASFFAGNEPREQFSARGGSLYRMVVSFDDDGVPRATVNFARGSSGEPDDPHFDDREGDWVEGHHVALPFRRAEVEARSSRRFMLPAAR